MTVNCSDHGECLKKINSIKCEEEAAIKSIGRLQAVFPAPKVCRPGQKVNIYGQCRFID